MCYWKDCYFSEVRHVSFLNHRIVTSWCWRDASILSAQKTHPTLYSLTPYSWQVGSQALWRALEVGKPRLPKRSSGKRNWLIQTSLVLVLAEPVRSREANHLTLLCLHFLTWKIKKKKRTLNMLILWLYFVNRFSL